MQGIAEMMATGESRQLFPYLKAVLGAGVLVGILFMLGQIANLGH
jgi:hypothetical protein